MLKITNVTKQFGLKVAVKDVNLEVKAGEIFALIGPNGSGKTTMIKSIAGLLRPTHGTIAVAGHDVVKDPVAAKGIIGYIPDEPALWPKMTGHEFLHFSGALYNIEENERKQRVEELLKIFNMEGIEDMYFEDYSRGNKQKFVILAALLHQPKLLLIDEPIVGLDPTSADAAKKAFSEYAAGGGSILLATHTLPVAQEIADRIGLLKNGELAATGTFSELKQKSGLGDGASLDDVYRALTSK